MPLFLSGSADFNTPPQTFAQVMDSTGGMVGNLLKNQMLAQYAQQYPQLLQNQVGMSNNQMTGSNLQTQNMPTAIQQQNAMNQANILGKNIDNQYAPQTIQAKNFAMIRSGLSPQGKAIGDIYGNNALPGIGGGITGMAAPNTPQNPNPQNQPQNNQPPNGMAGYQNPSSYPVIPTPNGLPPASGAQPLTQAQQIALRGLMGVTGGMMFTPNGVVMKNPTMGSSKSGAGGTYTDANGNVISTDSGTQTTRDQRAIAGLQNVQTYLNQAMQTLPQFQNGWQKAQLAGEGFANKWLGANYSAPSQYASGQASIKEAAEGFINGFGLNATNENVNKAIDIMTPMDGESPQGYKTRATQQLNDFVNQAGRAKGRLQGGIPLNDSQETASQLPTFNSKAEFQNWYAQQPADIQASVKAQLGK